MDSQNLSGGMVVVFALLYYLAISIVISKLYWQLSTKTMLRTLSAVECLQVKGATKTKKVQVAML